MTAPVLKYTLVRRHPETDTATALLAGQPVPDWAEDLVDPEDLVGGESTSEGYAAFSVDDLKAEIDRRNENRDESDHLSKQGKKAELIAALEADDAA